jgi:hypothetical protein
MVRAERVKAVPEGSGSPESGALRIMAGEVVVVAGDDLELCTAK